MLNAVYNHLKNKVQLFNTVPKIEFWAIAKSKLSMKNKAIKGILNEDKCYVLNN